MRLSWDVLVAAVFASAAASESASDDNPLSTASDEPGTATRPVTLFSDNSVATADGSRRWAGYPGNAVGFTGTMLADLAVAL